MAEYVLTGYWVAGYAEGDDAVAFEADPPVRVTGHVRPIRVGDRTTPANPGYLSEVVPGG